MRIWILDPDSAVALHRNPDFAINLDMGFLRTLNLDHKPTLDLAS